jgi:O-antigen ligase
MNSTMPTVTALKPSGMPRAMVAMGPVHRIALALVWITIALSALVFTEPAPVDLGMLLLVGLLPMIGLVRITAPLIAVFALWLVVAATSLFATMNAIDIVKALPHAAVTLFLIITMFVLAAFVAYKPERHTRLIFHAYIYAAVLAATAGLIGYFSLLPGAFELFTKYGRASGTFKDPNVYGPFLVPPLVFLLHRMLEGARRTFLWLALSAGLLSFAILLSFSRGAWVNLAIAVVVFCVLSFITAKSNLQRVRLICVGLGGGLFACLMLTVALQFDEVGRLFGERATLTQSYDEGPEGRFGGQQKAMALIVENPFGIGPQQFAPNFHFEEPHNVYLAMFLNAGWLGGGLFAVLILMTALIGLTHAFRRTASQPLFVIAYACFLANVLEGFLIDLDHWRHVFLLMAIMWGLILGDNQTSETRRLFDPRDMFLTAQLLLPARPARFLIPVLAHSAASRRLAPRRRALDGHEDRLGRAALGRRAN